MPQVTAPAPPFMRDPWAWSVLAAVLPLLARAWGAPLGEPFADDFNFLRHAFFDPGSWLDGGGAVIYWRPLSRQAYFALLGPLIEQAPLAVAILHAALLALASLLLYRAWRVTWPGTWAAAAASFPLLAESSRTFLLWPTSFQDLGALLFSALAIQQASRRRLAWAVAALAAALLCKETAVVTALLIPWLPRAAGDRGMRWRWAGALAATVVAWAVCYAAVMQRAGLSFQAQLEAPSPPLGSRFGWALESGLRDAFSLGATPGAVAFTPRAAAVALTALVLTAVVVVVALLNSPRRARLAAAAPWIAWGLAWFLANTALLTQVYPLWGSFRSAFGMIGLGVALVAGVWAAGPAALAALVALRLTALAVSPGPPARIALAPQESGATLDFASLARLSRFSAETRRALLSSHPRLPAGAIVAWRHRPLMAQHAFAHGEALQVWYRDSTLRWIAWDDVRRAASRRPDAVLEFEPDQERQVVALALAAAHAYLTAEDELAAGDAEGALAELARADSLQIDRQARVFLASIAGKRALCWLSIGDLEAARHEAERSLSSWRDGGDSRYVLAVLSIIAGKLPEARALLDSLLERLPFDVSARAMLDTVRARERAP